MLEYPELYTLAAQMSETIIGKTVTGGEYLLPNANIFNPAGAQERYAHLAGGKITGIDFNAPNIYVRLDNGYGIQFRQGGGKLIYNETDKAQPRKYNFRFPFKEGGSLTLSVLLWSYGVDAITHDEWEARRRIDNAALYQPLGGTLEAFNEYISENMDDPKQPVKVYITKHLAGIMSSVASEILLMAGIHPALQIGKLDLAGREALYRAMTGALKSMCDAGGRASEVDLFGASGRYLSSAERKNIGKPCPACGTALEKVSVGGVTAYCPSCQRK